MEHIGSFGESADEFYVPEGILPDGYVGEWKIYAVLGEVDPSRQVELARGGWENVPTYNWPDGMPPGSTEKNIMKKGMQYMMRPKAISDFIRNRDNQSAREQMRSKKEQVEGAQRGPFDPTNKGRHLSRVNTDFRPMEVPN